MIADMHPEDIKALLRKRGLTLADIAAAEGVSKQNVAIAIRSRSSARIEQAVAKALGLLPEQLWPSRHNEDGSRIRFRTGRPFSVGSEGCDMSASQPDGRQDGAVEHESAAASTCAHTKGTRGKRYAPVPDAGQPLSSSSTSSDGLDRFSTEMARQMLSAIPAGDHEPAPEYDPVQTHIAAFALGLLAGILLVIMAGAL
jgi:Ner family transcriptional regulator